MSKLNKAVATSDVLIDFAAFERIRASALADYGRALASAQAEYERAKAAAWADYMDRLAKGFIDC